MKFTKEFLQYLIVNENDHAELIEDTIIGSCVNNVYHMMIFKYEEHLYRKYYNCGKSGFHPLPFKHDENEIGCEEVEQIKRSIIMYEHVDTKG